jgi:FdhE protein
MSSFSWDRRIQRAEELVNVRLDAVEILHFYADVARFQKKIYEQCMSNGEPANIAVLVRNLPQLLALAKRAGPPALASAAAELAQNRTQWDALIAKPEGSEIESDIEKQFFARCLWQPYMEYLATQEQDKAVDAVHPACPFCGAKPVAGILRGEGDGAKRSLLCALCATEWDYRRIVCPQCGEEDKDKLPIYLAPEFDYVRVEACDTCKTYIKSVDLTKNGRAVPVVDELATVTLTIWAEEHGYRKLESNIFGM